MTAVVPLRHRYAGVCTSYFPLLPISPSAERVARAGSRSVKF